jgi:hypothetical protein
VRASDSGAPFVHLQHRASRRRSNSSPRSSAIARRATRTSSTAWCSRATLFSRWDASPTRRPPSDYTYAHIYYRSIAEKREDWLTTHDYLWRWDTDWFWCSKNLLAQNPLVRRLYGRERLGSRTYSKIMRWNARVGLTRAVSRLPDCIRDR